MEAQSPAQALCLLERMDTPAFIDKTQQECFYQYQIANNMDEEQEKHPECPVDLAYIKEQQDKDKNTKICSAKMSTILRFFMGEENPMK